MKDSNVVPTWFWDICISRNSFFHHFKNGERRNAIPFIFIYYIGPTIRTKITVTIFAFTLPAGTWSVTSRHSRVPIGGDDGACAEYRRAFRKPEKALLESRRGMVNVQKTLKTFRWRTPLRFSAASRLLLFGLRQPLWFRPAELHAPSMKRSSG